MIKKYLKEDSIQTLLDALKLAHNGKEVVFIDMDGVVADFKAKGIIFAEKIGLSFDEFAQQKKYRDILGFYLDLPVIEGAKESIKILEDSGKFDLFLLSAPSWGNVSSFSDKRIWIENNFPSFKKKMILSFQKGHMLGHYLIDDRIKYGVENFIGKHIHFGVGENYNWEGVLKNF